MSPEFQQARRRRLAALFTLLSSVAALPAQSQTAHRNDARTRAHVETLASDKLEGRMAGSAGEQLAADYIARELTRIGAKPLPGARTSFSRSSSPPARKTPARRCRRHARRARRDLVHDRRTCRRCRSPTAPRPAGRSSLPATAWSSRKPELRLRQLRRARRQGQDRPRPALLPRGCRSEDARDPRPLLRSALQGDGRAAARREGAARRHRSALAQRGRDDSDDVRHGAAGSGIVAASISGDAGKRSSPVPTRISKRRRRSSTRAIRTSPASRFPTSR